MAMWLCGYVAMWLYGYVVMWPCGSVSKIQISKFQRSKKLGAHIPKLSKFWSVTFPKIICFQNVPIYFLPPSPLPTPSPPHPPRLLVDLQPAIQFYSDFSCGSSLSLSPSLPPSLPSPSLLSLHPCLPPSLGQDHYK